MSDSEHRPTFGIISPAGGLPDAEFDAGWAALEKFGFGGKVFSHARERSGYLSAPVGARAADLTAAWNDPDVDAVLCSRGGFGSAHLLPLLDWAELKRRPMPLLGYSDITALHLAMDKLAVGVPIAAPMLRHFPDLDEKSLASLLDVLIGNDHELPEVEYITALSGFSGRPLAGNLTVMASLLGTAYFPDPSGRVLVLEEVGEPLYRIDRALTQLEQAGVFAACSGVVFGSFSDGDFTEAQLRELLFRVVKNARKPAVSGFPFGHRLPFCALSFDATLEVRGGKILQLFD